MSSYVPEPLRFGPAARPARSARPSRRARPAMPAIAGQVGSLWLLQTIAGVFAHAAFDLCPLALAISALFLLLAFISARELAALAGPAAGRRAALALLVGVLWQLPALLGSANLLREELGLAPYDGNSDLLDFAMQTWQTALMPVISLFPGQVAGRSVPWFAAYYVALAASAPGLVVGYVLAALPPAD